MVKGIRVGGQCVQYIGLPQAVQRVVAGVPEVGEVDEGGGEGVVQRRVEGVELEEVGLYAGVVVDQDHALSAAAAGDLVQGCAVALKAAAAEGAEADGSVLQMGNLGQQLQLVQKDAVPARGRAGPDCGG